MKSLLLALLVLSGIASARIGETPEECAGRYGKPVRVEAGEDWAMHIFSKGTVGVTCWFEIGKCRAIAFQLIDESRVVMVPTNKRTRFTDDQTASLLAANAGGSTWEKTSGDGYTFYHATADGKLAARSGMAGVVIEVIEERDRRKALLQPDAISKAIEGF